MASFLSDLGYAGSGFSSGFQQGINIGNQLLQQQGEAALGDAMAGVSSGSGSSSGLGSILSNLFPQQQSQAPQTAQAPQMQQAAPVQPQSVALNQAPAASPVQQQPQPPSPNALPVGNTGRMPAVAQPQPAPQPQGASGTAALGSPLQGPQPQQQGGPGASQGQQLGSGPFTLPQLVRSIQASNPGIRGRAMYNAVAASLPILNTQGLQAYHALQGQLGQERVGLGYDRLAQQSEDFAKREERLQRKEAAQEKWKGLLREDTEARDTYRQKAEALRAKANDFTASPEERKKAADGLDALNKEYNTASEKRRQELLKGPQEEQDSGSAHQAGEIYTASDGKKYRFKGGDWDSKDNFELVQ